MKKKLPTFVLFVFLTTVMVLIYAVYAVYSNVTIDTLKNNVVTAQKTWVNYVRLVNKVNSKEIKYLTNSNQLIKILSEVNEATKEKKQESLATLETFTENKLSEDIDLIVIYNADGTEKVGFEKGENKLPDIYLPQALKRVLSGERLVLNVNLLGQLYYISMAPVIVENKSIGAVLIGKKINNSVAAYIKELANANIIVFAKNRLLATSLTSSNIGTFLKKMQNDDLEVKKVVYKTKINSNDDVSYLKTSFGNFWAAGTHLANNTAGYILLVENSKTVLPYMYIQKNMEYILPLLLLIIAGISVLIMFLINKINTKVTLSTIVAKEKIENKSWYYSMKFDTKVDAILNSIISFFEIDFFNKNKEMNKLAKDAQLMVKTYKAKVIVEDFEQTKKTEGAINPILSKDCTVNSRKSTLYFSNVKGFNDIIKNYSPDKAFTLLSIYLKIQKEVIQKHNGKVVKQVDDRVVAAFESASHAENAIRAAFDVQNTIYRLSSVHVENFDISIGVSSGDVTVANMNDQETYMGYAAQAGANLCNNTPPGGVYIDKATYDMAGIHYLRADVDTIEVQGVNRPVSFYKFDDDSVVQQTRVIQEVDSRIKLK